MAVSAREVSLVVVARGDLDLSRGKLAAQAVHAASQCERTARRLHPRLVERWRTSGGRTVVLEVADEAALRRLAGEAREAGLVAELVTDAGRTEVAAGTLTVLGLGPASQAALDPLTKRLSVVR